MGVSKCFMKTSRVFMSVSEVFQGYFNFLGFLKVVLFLNKKRTRRACFLQSVIITQR